MTDTQTDRHGTKIVQKGLKRKTRVEILILENFFFSSLKSENKASATATLVDSEAKVDNLKYIPKLK